MQLHLCAGVLAALHQINPDQVGLQDFGRVAGCNTRQVARWRRQYEASTAPQTGNARQSSMLQLAEQLAQAAPQRDAALQRAHIVHGDFRLDNLVFCEGATGKPEVLAVLDWELSSLGDPLSDLAYNCLVRRWPLCYDLCAACVRGAAAMRPLLAEQALADLVTLAASLVVHNASRSRVLCAHACAAERPAHSNVDYSLSGLHNDSTTLCRATTCRQK